MVFNKTKISSKKGMTVSILLLVLLALLIVSTSLFYFITERTNINKKINTIGVSEAVFDRELILDSYLGDLVEKNSKGVKSKEEFIENMKNNLKFGEVPIDVFIMDEFRGGKVVFPEYSGIIESLNSDNVEIIEENGVLKSVRFMVVFDIDSREGIEGKFHLKYNYSKKFIGMI